MSQITREGRVYAEQCRACGQETTANKILHLCDWIDVCEHSIGQMRNQIAELQKETGTFRMKFKGGRNATSFGERDEDDKGDEQ
jgi:hypothetical protein